MNEYQLVEHYQKLADAVSDRFYKQTGVFFLLLAGITWQILIAFAQAMPLKVMAGMLVVTAIFFMSYFPRRAADRKIAALRRDFEREFMKKFKKKPRREIVGLFP